MKSRRVLPGGSEGVELNLVGVGEGPEVSWRGTSPVFLRLICSEDRSSRWEAEEGSAREDKFGAGTPSSYGREAGDRGASSAWRGSKLFPQAGQQKVNEQPPSLRRGRGQAAASLCRGLITSPYTGGSLGRFESSVLRAADSQSSTRSSPRRLRCGIRGGFSAGFFHRAEGSRAARAPRELPRLVICPAGVKC